MAWTIDEAQRRTRSVFTLKHMYKNYELNVQNPVIGCCYEAYIKKHGIKRPMSDKQRKAWEQELWRYICRVYYSIYKTQLPRYQDDLRDKVIGWELQKLDDLVNNQIVPEKAVQQLYAGGKK